ncbi:hypothetical protein ACO2Q1_00780 [Brevundimonas sp. VNH65]|uniref:hypothetical protein n=1 Tax=Brevundimonas sp. VNH65 TaxID=3400917 RepID=UPI003C08149F
MSRRSRLFIASIAAVAALAGSAMAQSTTSESDGVAEDDDITAMLREFRDKLGPILEVARISPDDFDRRLGPLVRAAVPTPPATGDWGFSIGFDFDSSVYDDPPEEGRLTVATDAAACASVYPGSRPVFRHRAVIRDGLAGHMCSFFGPSETEGGAMLSTALYVEGPDRHATLRIAAAGTVDGGAGPAEQMMRAVIDPNLAVADALGELIVDALVSQTKGGGRGEAVRTPLTTMASSLGAPPPVLDEAELGRLMDAAAPRRPEGDDRTWGSVMDFKIDFALGDAARRPDADGHRLLDDARACLPQDRPATEIAHFRRWIRDGLSGHVCGVTTLENDVWMLAVTTFTEGDGRRLRTTYIGSLAIDGEPEASAALGRARLEAQVALAEWASARAVDILRAAPAK